MGENIQRGKWVGAPAVPLLGIPVLCRPACSGPVQLPGLCESSRTYWMETLAGGWGTDTVEGLLAPWEGDSRWRQAVRNQG